MHHNLCFRSVTKYCRVFFIPWDLVHFNVTLFANSDQIFTYQTSNIKFIYFSYYRSTVKCLYFKSVIYSTVNHICSYWKRAFIYFFYKSMMCVITNISVKINKKKEILIKFTINSTFTNLNKWNNIRDQIQNPCVWLYTAKVKFFCTKTRIRITSNLLL